MLSAGEDPFGVSILARYARFEKCILQLFGRLFTDVMKFWQLPANKSIEKISFV
jgi:hypothetical protein